MTRRDHDRLTRAWFRVMKRALATKSSARFSQLYDLAVRIAGRIADRRQISLFGGNRP